MIRHCGLVATLVVTVSSAARAGTFDSEGTFSFDERAVFRMPFTSEAAQPGGLAIVEGSEPLEGGTFGRLSASRRPITLPIVLPPHEGGASFAVRLYARKNRVIADVDVEYGVRGDGNALSARLFPTGRVTSDGWYEIASAPVSVDFARSPKVSLAIFGSEADIDALEVIPDAAYHAPKRCQGVSHAMCGPGEFCAAGLCRAGALSVPPLPPRAFRESVSSYLAFRLRNFFGGKFTREFRLPIALRTLEAMRTAQDAWTYWNTFATAIRQLHDWHTKTGGPVDVSGRGAFPICVVEGDADLSHHIAPRDAEYPDVLVSHVGPTQNAGLRPGDRIVSVDGVHPLKFMESLDDVDWGAWRADDPHAHAEAAERLRFALRRWAEEVTVVRCDPATKSCSKVEVLRMASLPEDASDTLYPNCDHRPAYHLAEGNPDSVQHNSFGVASGLLQESAPGEALFGMIWNDVNLDSGDNPYEASMEDFRANARGLILDHRTGNGGTEPAAEYLTKLFRTPDVIAASSGFNGTVGWFDPPFSREDGTALFGMRSVSSDGFAVGDRAARSDLPVALLLARDGSASDWFPLGMKGAPSVRLFGRRTSGAFSSFLQFDYFGQFNWQFASGDLIRPDGTTQIGHGVIPDEEVLPRQSDLLVGRDTAHERALSWVRSCLAGACR